MAAAATAKSIGRFVPRASFAVPDSIPKTYFLGHHNAGNSQIKSTLSVISLILECRDFRLPLSTRNPYLEKTIAGRRRIIVYTKSTLGERSHGHVAPRLRQIHGDDVVFWDKAKPGTTRALLDKLKEAARDLDSVTGLRVMVVGMPNVGKSTLLNSLRSAGSEGVKKAKVAKTGDQAGVTRKVSTSVRIVNEDRAKGLTGGVYILDSPGIFQPYVNDGETMIKVALAHGIKKGLIPDEILADYLLYRINQQDPRVYSRYCPPTNDVVEFLSAIAKAEGKLLPGGVPDLHAAAAKALSQWREGSLGRFVLDGVTEEEIEAYEEALAKPSISQNQAKKQLKAERRSDVQTTS